MDFYRRDKVRQLAGDFHQILMDTKVEKLPKSVIKFHITATGDEVARFFARAIEILARELKMPGFRAGKVPKDIAEKTLGRQAIENQARELAITESYFEMTTQHKLVPLSSPSGVKVNNFGEEEGLEWEGEVEVLPEVKLREWKDKLKATRQLAGSKLKINEVKIEEEEVEKTLLALRKQLGELQVKDLANFGGVSVKTEKGDWVLVDIDVIGGDDLPLEKIKKFAAKNFPLVIGETNLIAGFEEELIGLEKESEKEFELTFPQNYIDKEIANKKVKFKIKINEIKKIILPSLDNEFAQKFGKENVEELKKAIEQDILNQKQQLEKNRFEDEALKEIIKIAEMEVPNILVEQEKDMILERFKHDLQHHKGIKFADYIMSLGKSEHEVREGFFEQAENNVRTGLALGQISKEEEISVDDRDVEEVMSMDIIRQTAGLSAEKIKEVENKIREQYRNEQFLASVKNSILARKTIDLIVGQIN